MSVSGTGRSRFRLSVNMGSYCTTEEYNVSNCALFINKFVQLLTCINEQVGVRVCYHVLSVCGSSQFIYSKEDNCVITVQCVHELCM